MKKLFFSIAFLAMILSCNGKKSEEHGHDHNDGTHQHTESGEHPEEVKQEEFTVSDDSIAKPEHDHKRNENEPHQH